MIQYPNLLKHNDVTLFWKILLERVSIGDAPFGTQILNHELIYANKRHRESISELSLKTSSIPEVIDFFKEVVGVNLQYVYYDSWKEIKRKVIKDNLIQDYVYRFQKDYQLTSKQTNYLSSMIHLYLTLKKITPSDIILETVNTSNGYTCTQIKSINGIYYSSQDNIVKFSTEHEYSDIEEEEEEDMSSRDEDEVVMNEEEDLIGEDDNIE